MRFDHAATVLALGALLLAGCAAPPSKVAEYGAVKTNRCADCRRDSLRLALPADYLPQRGVVLAYGRRNWPFTDWTIVDLDKRTIAAVETEAYRDAAGQDRVRTTQRDDTKLAPDEVDAIVAAANLVWNPPAAARPGAAASAQRDDLWSLVLLDRDAIYRDGSTGSVAAYARPLEQRLDAVRARRPIPLAD